jgi:glycosyltransferase involved in cell wall biosynthesis
MATHTPILATPVGGLSEILQDGVNAVLTEPRNAVMLSEKIRYLLENKNVREKIAQTAYEDAMVKHDISVVKKRFKGIIEGVCNTDYLSEQIS